MKRILQDNSIRDTAVCIAGLWLMLGASVLWLNPFWMSVAITTVLWIYLCSAWNIVGGILGQVSFGNAAFFGIGAYTSTILANKFGCSPWFGMLVGGAIASASAWVVGYFPFRWGLSELVFALLTLAFGAALQFGVSGVDELGGNNGLFVAAQGQTFWDFRFEHPASYLLTITAMASFLLAFVCLLYLSRTGVRWRAIRDNEEAAASIGVKAFRLKQYALTLSAFLTAFAGTFYAQYVGFIDPQSVFGIGVMIEILLFAVVGGAGTLIGPVIGPILLVPLSEGLRVALSGIAGDGINQLLFGAMLMLVIRLWPKGISGESRPWSTGTVDHSIAGDLGQRAIESTPTRVAASSGSIISVRGLRMQFGGLIAVKDVSFDVLTGEIVGVIGPNGAGKTTLFSMLAGFQSPTCGSISLNGEQIQGLGAARVCEKGIARTFQLPQLFGSFSVLETVVAGALLRLDNHAANESALRVLREIGLMPNKGSANLTLGDRRRLEVARALATEPAVVLLDEVLAGLTPKEVQEALSLIRSLRDRGITVVLIEHNMKAVMGLCDRIVVLEMGEVIKIGTPKEVASDQRVIEAYLGVAPSTPLRRVTEVQGGSNA